MLLARLAREGDVYTVGRGNNELGYKGNATFTAQNYRAYLGLRSTQGHRAVAVVVSNRSSRPGGSTFNGSSEENSLAYPRRIRKLTKRTSAAARRSYR